MKINSQLKTIYTILTALAGIFFGITFFLWQQGFIILHVPWQGRLHSIPHYKTSSFDHRSVVLHYWHQGRWRTVKNTVLWDSQNNAESIKNLVNSWIQLMQDEQIVNHSFWLRHSAVTSLGNEFLLSFNKPILFSDWSIDRKLLFIEGLLRTIRATNLKIERVYFLVQDTYMVDAHLDFSHPWPIEGFMQIK